MAGEPAKGATRVGEPLAREPIDARHGLVERLVPGDPHEPFGKRNDGREVVAHRVVQLAGDATAQLGLVTLAGHPLARRSLLLKLAGRLAPDPQRAGHERARDHSQDPLEVYEGEGLLARKVDGCPERGAAASTSCDTLFSPVIASPQSR